MARHIGQIPWLRFRIPFPTSHVSRSYTRSTVIFYIDYKLWPVQGQLQLFVYRVHWLHFSVQKINQRQGEKDLSSKSSTLMRRGWIILAVKMNYLTTKSQKMSWREAESIFHSQIKIKGGWLIKLQDALCSNKRCHLFEKLKRVKDGNCSSSSLA